MINKAIRMNTTQRFKDARKALADAQERASSLRHLETANACQQGIDRITELEAENERLKEYLKRVLDLDLDVASDEDRKVLEEIAALEGGDD